MSAKEKLGKRLSFMLGLMNVGVSGFIIGAHPTLYYLWYAFVFGLPTAACRLLNLWLTPLADPLFYCRYSPKAIVFCLARWHDFRKQKRHYLLYVCRLHISQQHSGKLIHAPLSGRSYDFCYWANAALLLYIILPHHTPYAATVTPSSHTTPLMLQP